MRFAVFFTWSAAEEVSLIQNHIGEAGHAIIDSHGFVSLDEYDERTQAPIKCWSKYAGACENYNTGVGGCQCSTNFAQECGWGKPECPTTQTNPSPPETPPAPRPRPTPPAPRPRPTPPAPRPRPMPTPPNPVPRPNPVTLPPSGNCKMCTGHAELDCLLENANLAQVVGLQKRSSVYEWDGFCDALKVAGSVGQNLYYDESSSKSKAVAEAAVNIASLLAQCKHESGQWDHCDETNWNTQYTTDENKPPQVQAACTQRSDEWYTDLGYVNPKGPGHKPKTIDNAPMKEDSCRIDTDMEATALTPNHNKLKCGGRNTAGCCWWGRGAIQTTGPLNYGLLHKNVVKEAASNGIIDEIKGLDLCKNPQAICDERYPSMRWLGAVYYWTSIVQGDRNFASSLQEFVRKGAPPDHKFNSGTGGLVNMGAWHKHAHANDVRNRYFNEIVDKLAQAGMDVPTRAPRPRSACDDHAACKACSQDQCCTPTWAEKCFLPKNGAGCSGIAGAVWCGGSSSPPAPNPAPAPAPGGVIVKTGNRCGKDWGAANDGGVACPKGTKGECPKGEDCYAF